MAICGSVVRLKIGAGACCTFPRPLSLWRNPAIPANLATPRRNRPHHAALGTAMVGSCGRILCDLRRNPATRSDQKRRNLATMAGLAGLAGFLQTMAQLMTEVPRLSA